MLAKVRTGYGFTKNTKDYVPGEIVDLTDEEYQSRRQLFEPVEEKKPIVKIEEPAAKIEEPAVKADEPTLENRAVLDSTAGAPIIPQGRRGRRK